MKNLRHISAIILITIVFAGKIGGQDRGQDQVYQHRSKLSRIRQEIQDYRKRIKNEQRKEEQILENLEKLDREIDLIHALIAELKKEEQQKLKAIERISREISTKRDELSRLQEIYRKRMITFYKYGRLRDLELLLTTKSFNQTLVWFKYLKLVAANDRRNYLNILKKKQRIEAKKTELKKELIAKRKIIEEKTTESERLKSNISQRNRLLVKVQKNKKIYLQKIKQYKSSAKEIEKLIIAEEQKRLNLENRGITENTDFPRLKGRMIWPTRGYILNHFGRQRHPRWKTITENIGIDIRAEFGEDVRAVADGVVTAITWQRGRGNIVIINHLGGYFTVYTHLSQILVQIDQKIKLGQVIGNVGDTGSLHGPMLHFEIWKSNRVLNPEEWLG